jgi:hypothetical protein
MPPARSDGAGDWPAQATDTIVRAVDTVRTKTTGPALTVSRAIVYGLLVAILSVTVVVMVAIVLVRMLDAYLPEAVFGPTHTWAAHLIVGIAFTTAGLILWAQRRAKAASPE